MTEYSPLVEKLIERTGFTKDFLHKINTPFGAQLDNMEDFIDILHSFKNLQFTIAPDYDMDGITSGIILYAGLSQLGFHINLSIPNYEHGHEFGVEDVDDIILAFPSTEVIITCDCAVNSADGIKYAQSLGVKVLVTDHHEQEIDCPADAMIDPCAFDSTFPLPGICGAAVAFLVVSAYARKYGTPAQTKYLNLLILFAGIGTVSDVMPLIYDNRFLVCQSLELTRELITNPFALNTIQSDVTVHPVFRTVFEGYAQLLKELKTKVEYVDEQFYGFTLAPMFNAPRRVGTAMPDAFNIFIAADDSTRSSAIANLLAANNTRKKKVAEYLKTIDTAYAPYIYITDAPQGMLGLLAGQLMHKSNLPTAVVHLDSETGEVSGSMRSPDYYPIIDNLSRYDDLAVVGHQGAGGIYGPLEVLRNALSSVTVPAQTLHEPVLTIGDGCDAQWWDKTGLESVATFLGTIAPFGKGFEYPLIEFKVPSGTDISAMGANKQHRKLHMPGCPPVLLWNTETIPDKFPVKLSFNYFHGQRTLQMVAQN